MSGGAVNAAPPAALRPGDVLLYSGRGPFSLAIRLVTASRYTHAEMYDGDGYSWASRDWIGVGCFEYRPGPSLVLRPRVPFDIAAARRFWRDADGEPYDWPGLVVSRLPALQDRSGDERAQFCSEALARAVRCGIGAALTPPIMRGPRAELDRLGVDPFGGAPAEAIHPGAFAWCPLFEKVSV